MTYAYHSGYVRRGPAVDCAYHRVTLNFGFFVSPLACKNGQSTSGLVYPHCTYHEHFSTIIEYLVLAAAVIFANHWVVVRHGPPASPLSFKKMVRQHQVLPASVNFVLQKCQPTLGISCPHHLWQSQRPVDVECGLPWLPLLCTQWSANVERVLSWIAFDLHTMIIWHHKLHVCIAFRL